MEQSHPLEYSTSLQCTRGCLGLVSACLLELVPERIKMDETGAVSPRSGEVSAVDHGTQPVSVIPRAGMSAQSSSLVEREMLMKY